MLIIALCLPDKRKAAEEAARQNYEESMLMLARLSMLQNETKSRYWLNKAVALGSERAKDFLDVLDKKSD